MNKVCVISGVCMLVLAAGCTSSPWQKAGVDRAAVQKGVRQCEQQANVEARKLAASGIDREPVVAVTPHGKLHVLHLTWGAVAIDPVAEDEFFRACMRERGYSRAALR